MSQKARVWLGVCAALVLLGLVWPSPSPVLPAPATHSAHPASGSVASRHAVAGEFTSPAGLHYGRDLSGRFESRLAHIMAHTRPDPSKLKHSMYLETSQAGIVALLDEAWKKRGSPERESGGHGREVYDVPMGRVVGTAGERRIRLVVEQDSADIVTAYPVR